MTLFCSLLDVGVGRRRTATVRAKSFANLFILSKASLDKTLMDHPKTRAEFSKKAEHILRQDNARGEGVEGITVVEPTKTVSFYA